MPVPSSPIPMRSVSRLGCMVRTRPLTLSVRHSGTNGWTSVWASHSNGEIAGCPPPAMTRTR